MLSKAPKEKRKWNAIKSLQIDWIYYLKFLLRHFARKVAISCFAEKLCALPNQINDKGEAERHWQRREKFAPLLDEVCLWLGKESERIMQINVKTFAFGGVYRVIELSWLGNWVVIKSQSSKASQRVRSKWDFAFFLLSKKTFATSSLLKDVLRSRAKTTHTLLTTNHWLPEKCHQRLYGFKVPSPTRPHNTLPSHETVSQINKCKRFLSLISAVKFDLQKSSLEKPNPVEKVRLSSPGSSLNFQPNTTQTHTFTSTWSEVVSYA